MNTIMFLEKNTCTIHAFIFMNYLCFYLNKILVCTVLWYNTFYEVYKCDYSWHTVIGYEVYLMLNFYVQYGIYDKYTINYNHGNKIFKLGYFSVGT